MNDTQKAAIHELLEIALTTPRETADIFLSWHPHCDSIDISVHIGGWTADSNPDFRVGANLTSKFAEPVEGLPLALRSYLEANNSETVRASKKQARIAELQHQL